MWGTVVGASAKLSRAVGPRLLGAAPASAPAAAAAAAAAAPQGARSLCNASRLAPPLRAHAAAALPAVGRAHALAGSAVAAGVAAASLLAARSLVTSARAVLPAPAAGVGAPRAASNGARRGADKAAEENAVAAAQDPFSSITDQIPTRPVTATETVSYSLVIVAGLAVAAAAAWAVFKELLFEPREYTVFGLALERCRVDPRVATRLGSPLSGYGIESSSRAARQRIRHKIETDSAGVEHVLVQFQLRGPRGVATVLAEGVKNSSAPGGYRLAMVRVNDPQGSLRPISVEPAEAPGFGLQPQQQAQAAGGFALAGPMSGSYDAPPPPPPLRDEPAPPPSRKSAWGIFSGSGSTR